MKQAQPIGCCAILTNSEGKILFGKRKNGYKPGIYGLPGGRVELNEKIELAIVREVAEETGLQDLKFSFIGVVRENQGNYDFIHFVFLAQVDDQLPILSEPNKCEGWEWFDKDIDLSKVLPGHAAAIELYWSGKKLADLVE